MTASLQRPGALAPLRHIGYRQLWCATLAGNIGHWAQLSAASWYFVQSLLRGDLAGMVQTAVMAPVLVFTMLGGALADRYDPFRVQFAAQLWTIGCAVALAVSIWWAAGPGVLLGWLFAHSVGLALRAPAWQACLVGLVGRAELPSAVLLNSSAFNLARVLGATLGGVGLTTVGAAGVFVGNAVLAMGLALTLYRHRHALRSSVEVGVTPVATRTGGGKIVLLLRDRFMRVIAWRSLLLGGASSALLTLLPVYVAGPLRGTASDYANTLACFGVGALCGTAILLWARTYRSVDTQLALRVALLALAIATLAATAHHAVAMLALLVGGAAWTSVFSLINTTVQLGTSPALRGTALAIYMTCMFGGMSVGSAIWAWLGDLFGVAVTYAAAATALFGTMALGRCRRLGAATYGA
jgi:predicted MFS family arabinose efflux permease